MKKMFLSLFMLLALVPPRAFSKESRDFSTPSAAPIAGVVERRAGAAYVIRATSRGRTALDMGEKILDGDRVLTESGRVHVRLKDGTLAELGEDSAMTVDRVFQRKRGVLEDHVVLNREDESVYRFENGLLRMTAIEIDPFQAYTLKTDVAVIEVQEPSDFIVAHIPPSAQYDIRMLSGKVTLVNIVTNEAQELKAGYSAVFKASGALQIEHKLSEQEIAFLKQRTGI